MRKGVEEYLEGRREKMDVKERSHGKEKTEKKRKKKRANDKGAFA